MNRNIPWHCIALAGAAVVAFGCTPNQPTGVGSGDRTPSSAPPTGTEPTARTPSAAAPAPANRASELMARADLQPVGDSTVRGTAEFRGQETGPISINLNLTGVQAGGHGVEVYQGTSCPTATESSSASTGEPGASTAPGAASAEHRSLGTVTADASGNVRETLRAAGSSAEHGFIGNVIVVHGGSAAAAQPAGNSEQPIACGAIEAAKGTTLSQSESTNRGA